MALPNWLQSVLAWFTPAAALSPPPPLPGPLPVPVPKPRPVPLPTPVPVQRLAGIYTAHNAARAAAGLAPLTSSSRLAAASQMHANWMSRVGTMAHSGIGDGDPWGRITSQDVAYTNAAENVAEGSRDVADVMALWMASAPHKSDILGPYTHIGAGVAAGARGIYWCVDFATITNLAN